MSASIKVKCFNGKAYDVDVAVSSDTVADIQARIAALSDIAAERQTLLFKGQVLDPASPISAYPIESGVTVSVVRRVGKASGTTASSKSLPAKPVSTQVERQAGVVPDVLPTPPGAAAVPDFSKLSSMMGGAGTGAAGGVPDLEAMMRQMSTSMGGGGMDGLGGADGGGPPGLDKIMSQMPQMMHGLMQSPALQEYLNDPSKQEASRDAIVNNPMLKTWLESDPEFAKVVNDPDQWQKSMEAAKSLFGPGSAGNSGGRISGAKGSSDELDEDDQIVPSSKRPSAADTAPAGINISKLSESYGHALGQSLVNSGLGLDPALVVKGLQSACVGKPFPMALPDYERSMAQLQTIAGEFLQKANLEDANQFFAEIKEDDQMVTIEAGKIAYERGDVEPDEDQPVALASSTVLVIVTARLLDGRHFFTCPAADETGETVHPLTLPLATAPPALAVGIKGMRETEARLLYVHPSAAEGMTEMFGDLLPPNALLIFDLQLVSANAPEEEITAAREATQDSS
jgi:FKBP-type peptidyl-prolyl cis-trans isomerase